MPRARVGRDAWRRGALAALAALAWIGITACGGPEPADDARLTVFAASSLTEALGALDEGFEAANRPVEVVESFAGSQILRLQIEQGAPADVFASADRGHMDALVEAGLVGDHHVFARNELVVIVPVSNPAGVETFAQLPSATRVVIGNPNVPIGRYARALLSRAAEQYGRAFESDVLSHVVSEEGSVRLVRAKVELGEADAAIVYRTDAVASDRVRVIEIPAALNVRADYHLGVVTASPRVELARRWVAFVDGDAGRAALGEHGFSPP